MRVGDVRERELDVRLVAATNRDLEAEVKTGRFRLDLFYRLGAARVVLPPLRERQRELPILARRFLEEACARAARPPMAISPAAMHRLMRHPWPGNVRELKNAMEYVATTASEPLLWPWDLPDYLSEEAPDPAAAPAPEEAVAQAAPPPRFRPVQEELQELERRRMLEALAATDGVHRRAAELIGMPKRTWINKFKLYRLGDQEPGDP
jgi:DNA-binding NtrC family response regulator